MFKEPRSSLPKVFVDRRVVVRESPIHGWGCFAEEDIEARTLIESAPLILCHKSMSDALFAINDCRHILQDYPFAWKDGMIAYAMGWAAVYNHQAEANCVWTQNFDYTTIEFTTKRKISAGEEITVRYLPLRLRGSLWFVEDGGPDVCLRELDADVRGINSKRKGYSDWSDL